eukprot:5990041-Prymnesium_polylepis.2
MKWMYTSRAAPLLRSFLTTAAQLRPFLSLTISMVPTLRSGVEEACSASTAARERFGIAQLRAAVGCSAQEAGVCDFALVVQIPQSRTGTCFLKREAGKVPD